MQRKNIATKLNFRQLLVLRLMSTNGTDKGLTGKKVTETDYNVRCGLLEMVMV